MIFLTIRVNRAQMDGEARIEGGLADMARVKAPGSQE
jgi:hypothetical protein